MTPEPSAEELRHVAEARAILALPTLDRPYVDPSQVRSSNPGCCFKLAGWRQCGTTKERGLLIFEVLP
jgi:hypothetical protein